MTCSNCKKRPMVDQGPHCAHCAGEAAKAPKMADDINNAMEAAGWNIRWTEEQVRASLLANAKAGGRP